MGAAVIAGVDEPLILEFAEHVFHDQLGSVVLITDGAGARAREVAYWPYGQVLYSSAILSAVPAEARGFIGERFDKPDLNGGPGCNTSTPGTMIRNWGSGGKRCPTAFFDPPHSCSPTGSR